MRVDMVAVAGGGGGGGSSRAVGGLWRRRRPWSIELDFSPCRPCKQAPFEQTQLQSTFSGLRSLRARRDEAGGSARARALPPRPGKTGRQRLREGLGGR
jgi:hypothetical protein